MFANERNRLLLMLVFSAVGCNDQGQPEPRGDADQVPTRQANSDPGAAMNASDSKDDEPIIDLGDGKDPNRKTSVRRLGDYPANERDRIKTILNSPQLKARQELVRSIAARGTLALALVDKTLPNGVLTEVHLNAPPPVSRFFVVSSSSLDDEVIDRATSLAFKYESKYPNDRARVKFTLFASGRYVRESTTNGRLEERQVFEGFYANRTRRSEHFKRVAARTNVSRLPGVGEARVVSLESP